MPANLAPEFQKHILGGQANLWTEYIPNLKLAEYMVFPRLAALAEVTWSSKDARNFDGFTLRLKNCHGDTRRRITVDLGSAGLKKE